jgi:hypothetical protein
MPQLKRKVVNNRLEPRGNIRRNKCSAFGSEFAQMRANYTMELKRNLVVSVNAQTSGCLEIRYKHLGAWKYAHLDLVGVQIFLSFYKSICVLLDSTDFLDDSSSSSSAS